MASELVSSEGNRRSEIFGKSLAGYQKNRRKPKLYNLYGYRFPIMGGIGWAEASFGMDYPGFGQVGYEGVFSGR